jgi:Predicted hydrolases or acyltransferases (alpha/beta hydrolase superfamily)
MARTSDDGGIIRNQKGEKMKNMTVVLVHGLFADGSGSWNKIIPLLQAEGLNVVAVQNPLTSIADDVAATKRAIDAAPGKVVLVGHSWGGNAVTQAGIDEKVTALVYIAAFAPSKSQSANELLKDYPPPEWFPSAIVDSGGVMTLPPEAISRFFAPDLPDAETRVMAAAQGSVFVRAFDDKVTETAWSSKPSWYIVATNDRMINPEIQKATAKKIGATVTVLESSHVPMLSKPGETADVIFAACGLSKKSIGA